MARAPLSIQLDEVIDLPTEGEPMPDMMSEYLPGEADIMGGEEIGFDEMEEAGTDFLEDFNANLVEELTTDELKDLSRIIVDDYTQDIEDRKPWHDRFVKGLDMLGLTRSDIDDGPFPGAASIVHPLLVEAQVQFWARAYAELYPASGPCKAVVLGASTQEKVQSADRVKAYLNYEMTTLDTGYATETSRLLLAVPFTGTAFRKTFRDPILDVTIGVYVSGEDIIAPWDTVDMRSAPRFSHRMTKTKNDVRKLQRSGFYRDIELPEAEEDEIEGTDVKEARADTQDTEHQGDGLRRNTRVLYECYVELDLPGFEDEDDRGKTGIELPYIVTVDDTSGEVLSIYRNWDETDQLKRREVVFTKYDYTPGLGFYGNGLLHLIGGLQEGATGALRSLLDSAATASLPGGFIAKDARLKDDKLIWEPGVWKQVEASAEDLNNAFFTPPVRDPSPVLYQLLEFLTNAAQRFTSTTEMMVGEANRNQPVGTTLALLEQGQKVMSAIHRGLHAATASELRLRKKIASRFVSDDGYPYDIEGDSKEVFGTDFAEVDIVPVSDPNVISTEQRVAMNQMGYQLATENPDILDRKVAIRRLLDGVKTPDVDELFIEEVEPMAYDAVGEIQATLMGKPILVTPDQQHLAYLHSWSSFLQNPEFGANPQVLEQMAMQIQSVVGQHMAYQWLTGVREQGVPASPIDPQTGQPTAMEVPPEQINSMIMQIAPALAQMPGMPGAPQEAQADPAAEQQMKLGHEDQKHQQKLQQLEQAHKQRLRHLEDGHEVKQGATVEDAMQKAEIRDEEHEQDIERKELDHQIDIQAKIEEQQIARAERTDGHVTDLSEKADNHAIQQMQAQDNHEQNIANTQTSSDVKLQDSINAATMSQEEREQAMVQQMGENEQKNAQAELDAHRETQLKNNEFENKKRLQSLAETGAKKKPAAKKKKAD